MKRIHIIVIGFSFFIFSVSHVLAGTTETSAESHEKRGDVHYQDGRNFQAIDEYRQAIKQGMDHPELYRKLAIVLYGRGLLDDAIVEMEKALALSPDTDLLVIIELGILYLAKDRLENAQEQFFAALQINPGFADAYYYLGEVFLRKKEYDMAWLFVKMTQRLGLKAQDLMRKLSGLSNEPGVEVEPRQETGEDVYIRQILVHTHEKAEDILNLISEGEIFDDLAFTESMGLNATIGGFVGHFRPLELHPNVARALRKQEVLAEPVIVQTEKGFHVVQRIMPFDFDSWKKILADSGRPDYVSDNLIQRSNIKKFPFTFRCLMPEFEC